MKIAAAGLLLSAVFLLSSCAAAHPELGDRPPPPPASAPAPPQPPSAVPGAVPASMLVTVGRRSRDSERVTMASGAKVKVYDNVSLAGGSQADRALVVVHGTGRNASGYFDRAMSAAKSAGADEHTVVVAPQFSESKWSDDWKDGGGRPSSFEIMDGILGSLADHGRFPNLKHITVTGHSAGGQFTQRYATFGKAPNVLPWISVNFVAMNPSSYLYFGPERPTADGRGFGIPPPGCSDYNTYKYGLDGRSGYVGELTNQQALDQYLSRRVTIVNGGDDSFDNGDLDSSCEAALEGPHRLARGELFFNHIHALYPHAPHDYVVVPGVDHDSEEMLGSELVRPMLFTMS